MYLQIRPVIDDPIRIHAIWKLIQRNIYNSQAQNALNNGQDKLMFDYNLAVDKLASHDISQFQKRPKQQKKAAQEVVEPTKPTLADDVMKQTELNLQMLPSYKEQKKSEQMNDVQNKRKIKQEWKERNTDFVGQIRN